jgi:small subunit ribosomal protein S16
VAAAAASAGASERRRPLGSDVNADGNDDDPEPTEKSRQRKDTRGDMALSMRLMRKGAKRRPFYRIVVADSRSPRDGRFVEQLGFYNPMVPPDHDERYKLNAEKAKYWLDKGAQPTDRVRRLLAQAEVMGPRPIPNQTKKNQPKSKES